MLLVPTRAPCAQRVQSEARRRQRVLAVAAARARRRRAASEPLARQLAGDVLGGVHGEVDLAAAAARPRARVHPARLVVRAAPPCAAAVAARRRATTSGARRQLQPVGDQSRLRERERAAASADPQSSARARTARAPASAGRSSRTSSGASPCRDRRRAGVRLVVAEPEQLAHELEAGVPALVAEAAQADRRLVQQPAHHRAGDRLHAREVARRGRLPAASFSASTCSTSASPCSRSAPPSAARRAGRASARSGGSPPRRSPARRDLLARVSRLRATTACRSSMSYSVTPSISPQRRVDVARHGDVDQQQRPRRRARRITSSSSSRPTIGCGEEVEETTMSARAAARAGRRGRRPSRRSAARGCSARSAWRLATNIVPAPCSASACAVSSLVSPAPRITTWRSASAPSTPWARSTATEGTLTRQAPMPVSERTRLPVVAPPRTGGWAAAR